MAKKEKFDYFDSYVQLTEKAMEEADLLVRVIENFDSAANIYNIMEEAHQIEHQGDIINHKVSQNVALDFITPIDREDLLALSCNLDNILDDIEDIIQHFYVFDVHEMHPTVIEFAKLIKKATEWLNECAKNLSNFKKNKEKINKCIIAVNDIEEDADLLYMDTIRELYTKNNDSPIKVMIWSNIFQAFESCIDNCEHTSDVIGSVILKNS